VQKRSICCLNLFGPGSYGIAENIEVISIYNMLGEKLFEASTRGNDFEYDFSHHEVGFYLVRIQTDKGIVVKQVTVQ
jgi:hypothetical protein